MFSQNLHSYSIKLNNKARNKIIDAIFLHKSLQNYSIFGVVHLNALMMVYLLP